MRPWSSSHHYPPNIIAEHDGDIIGVATLEEKVLEGSGRPTLDTLFVVKEWPLVACGLIEELPRMSSR
jgi:hypothetical protein